jgi:hypothetical protein
VRVGCALLRTVEDLEHIAWLSAEGTRQLSEIEERESASPDLDVGDVIAAEAGAEGGFFLRQGSYLRLRRRACPMATCIGLTRLGVAIRAYLAHRPG